MRKLTTSVADVLLDLNNIIVIEIKYMHESKFSIIFQDHLFEVVTFEILDVEGSRYEEVHVSCCCMCECFLHIS